MGNDRSGEGEEFGVALDAIHERIKQASFTDWTSSDASHQVPPSEDETSRRLLELQREERIISKRRRELHARIDTLEAAPVPLNLTFSAQLDAYKRAEEDVSRQRRRLHREIDELAGVAPGSSRRSP